MAAANEIISYILMALGFLGATLPFLIIKAGDSNRRLSPNDAKLQLFFPNILGSIFFFIGVLMYISPFRNENGLSLISSSMAIIAIYWSFFVLICVKYRKTFVAD